MQKEEAKEKEEEEAKKEQEEKEKKEQEQERITLEAIESKYKAKIEKLEKQIAEKNKAIQMLIDNEQVDEQKEDSKEDEAIKKRKAIYVKEIRHI